MDSLKLLDRSYFNYSRKIGTNHLTYEKMQNGPEFSSDLNKCRNEKLQLQAVVSDLTQVNRRWQRYNNDVQCYVKKLQATIEEQQEQLNNIADIKADKLMYSKESNKTNVCTQCQPLVELLRKRIHYLELELVNQSKSQDVKMFNQQCVLNLQHRLRRANNQIDHLSKVILSKRILNPGSSYGLPGPSTHSRLVNLCGFDRKIYECDSGYGSHLDTEKSLLDRGLVAGNGLTSSLDKALDEVKPRSSSSEEDITTIECESRSIDTDKISVKETKLSQPDNFIRESNDSCFLIDEDSSDDKSPKLNIACPISLTNDDLNIVHKQPQVNDKFDDIYEPPSAFERGYYIPNVINVPEAMIDRLNKDSFKYKNDETSYPILIQDSNNEWPLNEQYKYRSADFILNCPHCSASFPPGSEGHFEDHIKWCQSSFSSS